MFFVTNLTWNGLLLIPVIKRMLYLGNAFLRSDSSDSPGVANRTKPNQKPIEPNRSIGVRLVRQSNIIELELFREFD